jgi:ABC-2 type transport system permease protein
MTTATETTIRPDPPISRSAAATVARLFRAELRLVLREPIVLAFVFAFPVVTVLVIAGAFTAEDAPDFGGVEPSHWYVSSYLAVIIAAIGLVMVPVHVAAYRERGVLRRFTAAGFPRWSFAAASIAVGVVLTLVASAVMLAVAAPMYGLPPVDAPVRTVLGLLAGGVAFTSLGLLIGSVVPNARAAQGIGLLATCCRWPTSRGLSGSRGSASARAPVTSRSCWPSWRCRRWAGGGRSGSDARRVSDPLRPPVPAAA